MSPWAEEGAAVRAPGMLMLGASGRNVGKTEMACALLRRFAREQEIVAVKVTTVSGDEGGCPRGGRPCGACSLREAWCIEEETRRDTGKDTARMLASGASRVLWLRSRRERLADAAADLLAHLPPGTPIICESNSLRRVLEPDLFVIMDSAQAGTCKPFCREVFHHRDALGSFDGNTLRPAVEDLCLRHGRWHLRREAAAIILAGGRSSRMGTDKAMLPFGGRPLIEHVARQVRPMFAEVLLSVAAGADYGFLGHRMVTDRQPGQGPLMGIASALAASRHDLNLIVSCDMPEVPADVVGRLLRAAREADGAVAVGPDGHPEPLLAVYRRSMLASAETALASGARRVVSMFDGCRVRHVPVPAGFRNLNTPAEYRESRPASVETTLARQ
jgi:molybdenum cofactor guanylyltransferase